MNFAFQITQAIAVPGFVVDFPMGAVNKATLTYMSISAKITEPAGNTVDAFADMQLSAPGASLGSVLPGTFTVGGPFLNNVGWPYCTAKQSFRGCYELPQFPNGLRLSAQMQIYPGYAIVALSNLTFFVQLQIDTV